MTIRATFEMLIHGFLSAKGFHRLGWTDLMTAATRKLLWRLGWLTVLAMHVPLAMRLGATLSRGEAVNGFSLALIGASVLLFAAEIVWCPLLSICSSRRRLVVMLMIIALVHTGMIESPHDLLWLSSGLTSFAVVLAITFVLALIGLRKIPHISARSYIDRWLALLPPAWPRTYRVAHPSHAPPIC